MFARCKAGQEERECTFCSRYVGDNGSAQRLSKLLCHYCREHFELECVCSPWSDRQHILAVLCTIASCRAECVCYRMMRSSLTILRFESLGRLP